jgi:hypothetical protein
MALRDYATTFGGREQLSVRAFANAMEIIPKTLIENAGGDPLDKIVELRSAHESGDKNAGISAEGCQSHWEQSPTSVGGRRAGKVGASTRRQRRGRGGVHDDPAVRD